MGYPHEPAVRYGFGDFCLDLQRLELTRRGQRVRIQNLPFQILLRLVQANGSTVRRETLREILWPNGTYVEFDQGLNTAMRKLRLALGDSADSPQFVETVPRQGYRFIGSAEQLPQPLPDGNGSWNWKRALSSTLAFRTAAIALVVIAAVVLLATSPNPSRERDPNDQPRSAPTAVVLVNSGTDMSPAGDALTRGRKFLSHASLVSATEEFERAIQTDPASPRAYAYLAISLALRAGLRPRDRFPEVEQLAGQALALDANNADALTAQALVSYLYDWEWARAERLFVELKRRAPEHLSPSVLYADFLLRTGRPDEALQQNIRARELAPNNLATQSRLSSTYYWTRDYDAAIREVTSALLVKPNHAFNRHRMAEFLAITGRYDEALSEIQSALSQEPGDPHFIGILGYIEGRSGRTETAERTVARLRREARQRYVSSADIALVHLGLGRYERALDWLESAYTERDDALTLLRVEPRWDPLRSHPRFQALVAKMNFPSLPEPPDAPDAPGELALN